MILFLLVICLLNACGTEAENSDKNSLTIEVEDKKSTKGDNRNTEVNNDDSIISSNNTYDPHLILVGDTYGEMSAKTISVKDINEDMTLVDIQFESEAIEITGEFNNFVGDYHVLIFTPNEESKAKFPHHNLFEYETTLYFFDEVIFKQFEKYKEGTATIIISGYHEVVSYKDEINQNSNLINVVDIQ